MQSLGDSNAFDAMNKIGTALVGMGHVDDGVQWLAASMALPGIRAEWSVYAKSAMTLREQFRFDEAMMFIEKGLMVYPDELRLRAFLSDCLSTIGKWDEALKHLNYALERDPTSAEILSNKAFCLQMLERYREAIECYNKLEPTPAIILNWGNLLMEQGKSGEALALLEKHDLHSPRLDFLWSNLWLGTGDWARGWKMYQVRHGHIIKNDFEVIRDQQSPINSIADIQGKHVLLCAEQGLGDIIMFARYAKLLRPHVAKLSIQASKPLRRLLSCMPLDASFEVVDHIPLGASILPMMDVPTVLETTVDTVPDVTPYFVVPQDLLLTRQLPVAKKPRVGLVWTGALGGDAQHRRTFNRRSMPFGLMQPLLNHSDKFEFVSLQMPDQRVNEQRLLQPLQNDFDLLDTAAVIQQLDLVIAIDSTVAHLAGALGVPIWLLNRFDGCWRWFWDGRDTSSWYPTMTIYRQKMAHTWPEVIRRVGADLEKL